MITSTGASFGRGASRTARAVDGGRVVADDAARGRGGGRLRPRRLRSGGLRESTLSAELSHCGMLSTERRCKSENSDDIIPIVRIQQCEAEATLFSVVLVT